MDNFDRLAEIMRLFREVAEEADDICVVADAEALGRLTLSLQEKVRDSIA